MDKQDHHIEEGMLFAAEDINKREGEVDPLTPKKRGRKRSTVTEERPPLTAEQMREMLTEVKEVETATGIRYINFRLTKKMLIGIRERAQARNLPSISMNCTGHTRSAFASPVQRSSDTSSWGIRQP